MCIYSERDSDTILFTSEGGVDIGDVDAKAKKMVVEVKGRDEKDGVICPEQVKERLLEEVNDQGKKE